MMTKYGTEVSRNLIYRHTGELIGKFYKILPIKESGSATFSRYVGSLLRQMLGAKELFTEWQEDSRIITLLETLQYMADHPDCDTELVRSDVFGSINLIKQLQEKYHTA